MVLLLAYVYVVIVNQQHSRANFSVQIVWHGVFFGENVVVKQRFAKAWRHTTLDNRLISRRTSAEVRALAKVPSVGVPVPRVRFVDARQGIIVMTAVPGRTIKAVLKDGVDVDCMCPSRNVWSLCPATYMLCRPLQLRLLYYMILGNAWA